MWRVSGGIESGGILVRVGQQLNSQQSVSRLSAGAIVKELELHGDRLRYQLVHGEGPDEGWVSIKVKGKELLVKHENEVADDVRPGQAQVMRDSAVIQGSELLQRFLAGQLEALIAEYHATLRDMPKGPEPASVDAASRLSGVPMPWGSAYIPVLEDTPRVRRKLLFLGDSITHGSPSCPSAPFCAAIAQHNSEKILVENAGWGGVFSFQLLAPEEFHSSLGPLCLPSLESHRCDYACILVGTNDAMTICAPAAWTDMVRSVSSLKTFSTSPKLPDDWKTSSAYNPSLQLFEKSLVSMVQKLKAATHARIAIATPPLLGEDLTEILPEKRMRASPFATIRSMASIVWNVAKVYDCDVLPLTECMTEHLKQLQTNGSKVVPWTYNAFFKLMSACAADWSGTGKPLEDCGSQETRPSLTYDLVHFNETGAALHAALIDAWLSSLQ
eukprot:TRINITY_DN89936_c0_g1_i1.p1 TRINITY_DN89936_c0_g1~~TRINITY_DN89936_c0_g1_i1.p1  ORF type:complete len:443 (-),score=65.78 TRINITY_DN89936_c0_g1_i1:250-1578(-)